MAFIDTKNKFNKIERNFSKQDISPATYSTRDSLFQINSYSKQGNASQTIQFDLEGLKDLISIIKREFPNVEKKQSFATMHTLPLPHNRIIFGAPGTGKSHLLEKDRKQYFDDAHYERVTFHPSYTYSQFVGAYKPVALKNTESKDDITYSFVPGPFCRTLAKAIQNPSENFLLVIEEINRANVAAVFGDVFQLLDRDESGKSE